MLHTCNTGLTQKAHTNSEMKNLRRTSWQIAKGKWQMLGLCLLPFAMSLAVASGPGTTTGELLKIPVGARAIGMGEAYTAAADDTAALAWNPAGMSFAQQKQATFMHSTLIESVHYEHMAFIAPGDNYSYGASLGYLGFGDIAGYGDAAVGGTPEPLGNQSAYSYILSGGASGFVYDRLALGITGAVLRESLAGTSAGTFAANLGALYGAASHPWGGDYRFGLSALNLGPGLKYVSESAPLPRKIKMGASAMHVKELPLNFTADFTIPNDNDKYIAMGGEYWFRDLLALRLGYVGSNDQGKGLRVGMGLKLREFLFDYAYGAFGDFGATHRIELSLKWGERIHQLNKEQRAILKDAKRLGDQGDYIQEILAMNELLEKDPTNDRILKHMIGAHEHMLQNELKEAVAQNDTATEVPSPEEFALQDLVPGQQAVAKAAAQPGSDPLDLMGFNALPDASSGGELMAPSPAPSPAVVPAPTAVPMVDTRPTSAAPAAAPAAPAADGVLLNPADIYGN